MMWYAAALIYFGNIDQQRNVAWGRGFKTKAACEKFIKDPTVPKYMMVIEIECVFKAEGKKVSV